jgi:hypothetical protein
MQKVFKRILFALTLVLAIACVCSFAPACGGDNSQDTTSYSVTLLYPNGDAVDGTKDGTKGPDDKQVYAQWCVIKADGTTGQCSNPTYLDANGTATISNLPELKTGEKFHLQIEGIPTGYTCDDTYVTEPGNVKITLKAVS